jgi:alpha-beta hydrolase superfamily lysophospholipase
MKTLLMMSRVFAAAVLIGVASCSKSLDPPASPAGPEILPGEKNSRKSAKTYTYVLVPGAWHPADSWEMIEQNLQARGHRVVSVELPGLGTDRTRWAVNRGIPHKATP